MRIKIKIKNLMKHPLATGGLVMVGGSMGVNVINYIYHLLMGRVMGPADYGVLASLYSIIYLLGIVPISASVSIIKFISAAKDQNEVLSIYAALKRFMSILAIVILLILLVSSPFIAGFLRINNYWSVLSVSLILFFILLTLVNQATSQGLLKFKGYVGPALVSAVIKLALGFGLVLLGWSVFGAMVGVVFASLASYLYSSWFIKRILKQGKIHAYNLKSFFRFSFPVLVQALAFTSFFTTDVILVKHFFNPFDAGIYAALSTLGKIIYFAASPITTTMFPIVSARHSRGENHQRVFFAALATTVLLSSTIVFFYWLFPNLAIGLLYGKAYLSAKAELVWMGAFILLYTLSYLLVNYSLSLGKIKIVIFPLIISMVQIPAIWFYHKNILEVIQISLSLSGGLFLMLVFYLGYIGILYQSSK